MKIYTLEKIYLRYASSLVQHEICYIIEDAVSEGYTVSETVKFLQDKGYNKNYIEEELEVLRRLQLIAPWEPD